MLHFAKSTGGANPFNDDQGQTGATIFGDLVLDGTPGGAGDTEDVALFVFNDDNNFKFNAPVLGMAGSAPPALNTWFRFLDDDNVAGSSPTETEWTTFGVPGNLTMTLGDISPSGGLTPERKFWLRINLPAGTLTANLSGLKLNVQSVEEAV